MEVVSLTDKLRELLAFAEIEARDHFARKHPKCKRDSSPVEQDMICARWENTRLKSIHGALIRVVEAADSVDSCEQLIKKSSGKNTNMLFDLRDTHEALHKTLTELEELLKNEPLEGK
jgi:GTP1/Obg family GTP-binding protein